MWQDFMRCVHHIYMPNIFLYLLLPQTTRRECVNVKFTHPFNGLYWNAPIHFEGCISIMKNKKKDIVIHNGLAINLISTINTI
jgi:hypothetical protein